MQTSGIEQIAQNKSLHYDQLMFDKGAKNCFQQMMLEQMDDGTNGDRKT